MKKVLVCVFAISFFTFSNILAANQTEAQTASVDKVDAQTKLLEQQIAELRSQVAELRAAQKAALHEIKTDRNQIHWNQKAIKQLDVSKAPAKNPQSAKPTTQQIPIGFTPQDNGEAQFLGALRNSVSVITSPYLGLRSSYDASDLMVNLPSMNEDLVLLRQRQDMELQADRLALPFGSRPLLMVSGDLLPQLIMGNNYQGNAVTQATLSGAELDIQAISGRWASGFLAISYDNAAAAATGQNISTVDNSRLYVSRGFVTIGNLNTAPVYLTAGQMYAPYGNYSNSLVTAPLTQAIGRLLIRSVLLGYSQSGAYAEAYVYNGDTYVTNRNTINEAGLNAGYKNTHGDWTYDFGGGFVTNIADSQGAQDNSLSTSSNMFGGFGSVNGSEQLDHRVPGADLHTEIRFKNWNFNGEYIGATQSYNAADMTYNGKAATPRASHLELDYNHEFFRRPWTFALAYDHSWQALAYNVPEQSYFAVMSVSIWKDTIESIEFRHDENYSSSSTATGNGGTVPITPAGTNRNTVTMQLGFYF